MIHKEAYVYWCDWGIMLRVWFDLSKGVELQVGPVGFRIWK